MFCIGVSGDTVAGLPLGEVAAFGPGGVILFARNIGSSDDLRAVVDALRACGDVAPLITIDQEGGRVARIVDESLVVQLPAPMALAATGDPALCERLARRLGHDLAQLGISVDFAPCVDLALDPRNTVIGTRSFGDVAEQVATFSAAFANGLAAGGVAAAIKHFPGHGATHVDSHTALPHIDADEATLRARDLAPFAALIGQSAAAIVMTAHILVDALDPHAPATLSAPILTGLLRTELGFTGVIATDCLEMDAIAATVGTVEGAVRALRAGADLLLVSHDLERARAAADAIVAAIEAGTLPLERLASAARRVRLLRERYAVPAPAGGPFDPAEPLAAVQRAATVIRGDVRLRAQQAVTVISFEGALADGVAGAPAQPASLSAQLRARRWKSELMRVALEPDDDDIDLLLAHLPSLGERNFVIVMRRAHLYVAQRRAIERILAVVPDAIVVSAREPYDAAVLPAARNVVCIYGDEALAFAGCADLLAARIAPQGRLPVSLDRISVVR